MIRPIPLTPEIAAVARRVIWFEEPEQALADPVRFLAYAMTYATKRRFAGNPSVCDRRSIPGSPGSSAAGYHRSMLLGLLECSV